MPSSMAVDMEPLLDIGTLHWSLQDLNLPDNEGKITMIARKNAPENTLVE